MAFQNLYHSPRSTYKSHNSLGRNTEILLEMPAAVEGMTHLLTSQITENYLSILNKHVIPNMENSQGLRLRELRVLNAINLYNYRLQASDIVAILRYDPATVSRALARLEEKGMVEKTPHETDRRAFTVGLTEDGLKLATEFSEKSAKVYEFLDEMIGDRIAKDSRDMFMRIAQIIRDRTQAMESVPPRLTKRFLETEAVAKEEFPLSIIK